MVEEKPFEPATRIFGVVARAAPYVLLIRRGPSKHVLTIGWDTLKHEFRTGQWLKGRIYEDRCDLSPSGDKFVYFAANHKGKLSTWTAVSRAPYLTALLLWDNVGAWGGGGVFDAERVIALNKRGAVAPQDGFVVPKGIQVKPIAPWAGRGEDDPIREHRMVRDGWTLEDAGVRGDYSRFKKGARFHWEYSRPERWRKQRGTWTLERRQVGVGEIDGAWRVVEHSLLDAHGAVALDFGRSDWADWSLSDELLLAREGRVYHLPFTPQGEPRALEELIDLRALRFEAIQSPPEARTWHQRVEGRRIK